MQISLFTTTTYKKYKDFTAAIVSRVKAMKENMLIIMRK